MNVLMQKRYKDYKDIENNRGKMSENLIENVAFMLQCKECEYNIENGDQNTI